MAKASQEEKTKVELFRIGDHVYGTVRGTPEGIAKFIELLGQSLSGKKEKT
jgi:hypothetical protein